MGAFTCQRCQGCCCQCQGCHAAMASDNTQGCTRCNPAYEQGLIQQSVRPQLLTGFPQNINRPRNIFTDTHGQPQVTYKR